MDEEERRQRDSDRLDHSKTDPEDRPKISRLHSLITTLQILESHDFESRSSTPLPAIEVLSVLDDVVGAALSYLRFDDNAILNTRRKTNPELRDSYFSPVEVGDELGNVKIFSIKTKPPIVDAPFFEFILGQLLRIIHFCQKTIQSRTRDISSILEFQQIEQRIREREARDRLSFDESVKFLHEQERLLNQLEHLTKLTTRETNLFLPRLQSRVTAILCDYFRTKQKAEKKVENRFHYRRRKHV